jgi:hypothetical protein
MARYPIQSVLTPAVKSTKIRWSIKGRFVVGYPIQSVLTLAVKSTKIRWSIKGRFVVACGCGVLPCVKVRRPLTATISSQVQRLEPCNPEQASALMTSALALHHRQYLPPVRSADWFCVREKYY